MLNRNLSGVISLAGVSGKPHCPESEVTDYSRAWILRKGIPGLFTGKLQKEYRLEATYFSASRDNAILQNFTYRLWCMALTRPSRNHGGLWHGSNPDVWRQPNKLGTGSDFDFCPRKRADVKAEIQTSPQFTCNPDLNQARIIYHEEPEEMKSWLWM